MVSSLSSIVLYSVPIAMVFEMLKTLYRLPIGQDCLRALFRRSTKEQLRDFAKTLPWDHPVARKLDHEVHRRRMAGESYDFHFFSGAGSHFLIPFFIFSNHSYLSGSPISTNRIVAYRPLSLPSSSQIELGSSVLGSNLFVLNFFFFVRSIRICGKPTRVSHIPLGSPSHSWWGV